jgi:hypothetical protein
VPARWASLPLAVAYWFLQDVGVGKSPDKRYVDYLFLASWEGPVWIV